MISSVTEIPQRVLMGSEKGELSSGQDAVMWRSTIQNRREELAEAGIVRPFIDKMVEHGVISKPSTERYSIKWSDLFSPSEKDQAETGKIRATAVQSYLNNPVAVDVIPPSVFIEFMLGLSKDQIELVHKMLENPTAEEEELTKLMDKFEKTKTDENV